MDERLQCKQMATQIHDMQNSIQQHAHPISNEMNDDFVKLFSGCDQANVPKYFFGKNNKNMSCLLLLVVSDIILWQLNFVCRLQLSHHLLVLIFDAIVKQTLVS